MTELETATKLVREEVAKEIRTIAQNLEAMYGRIAGMTAWYDSLYDHADKVEKGERYRGSDGTRMGHLAESIFKLGQESAVETLTKEASFYNTSIQAEFMAKEGSKLLSTASKKD